MLYKLRRSCSRSRLGSVGGGCLEFSAEAAWAFAWFRRSLLGASGAEPEAGFFMLKLIFGPSGGCCMGSEEVFFPFGGLSPPLSGLRESSGTLKGLSGSSGSARGALSSVGTAALSGTRNGFSGSFGSVGPAKFLPDASDFLASASSSSFFFCCVWNSDVGA